MNSREWRELRWKKLEANPLCELSEYFGMSLRTIQRKAKELGLEKDPQWIADMCNEHSRLAFFVAKIKGHPGTFKKGVRANPDGEWKKGHVLTHEQMAKRSKTLKEW